MRGVAEWSPLSSADRVLFPDDGITKGDLFAYYDAVAPVLVPHLRDRPFTMKRYREGIAGDGVLPEAGAEGHALVDPDAHFPTARARATRSSTSRSSTRRRRCSGWCRCTAST